MLTKVAWVAGMIVSVCVIFGGAFFGFREMQCDDYIRRLDYHISRAENSVYTGEMVVNLNGWLSSYDELKVGSEFQEVRDRVQGIRDRLISGVVTGKDALLMREQQRTKVAALPRIGKDAFNASNSWTHSCWEVMKTLVFVLMITLLFLVILLYYSYKVFANHSSETSTHSDSYIPYGPSGYFPDELIEPLERHLRDRYR